MRIGFLSPFDRGRIEFARANGFGSVELLVGPEADYCPPRDGWRDRAAAVRAAYDEAGLRISCIGAFYRNSMDADAGRAEEIYHHVRHAIELAQAMQVPVVSGFAGRIVGVPLEHSLGRFREIWSAHASFAAEHGVRIAFEPCPMGEYHTPYGGINCICTPAMWERCFNEVQSDAVGLEWDPSHLVCQRIDPIINLRQWGRKVYHVHAKDGRLYPDVVDRYGLFHPGAIEHCFPGFGDSDWGQIIKELRRCGYASDLNIEGWHDDVFRRSRDGNGPDLEDLGMLIARRHLSQYVE